MDFYPIPKNVHSQNTVNVTFYANFPVNVLDTGFIINTNKINYISKTSIPEIQVINEIK